MVLLVPVISVGGEEEGWQTVSDRLIGHSMASKCKSLFVYVVKYLANLSHLGKIKTETFMRELVTVLRHVIPLHTNSTQYMM